MIFFNVIFFSLAIFLISSRAVPMPVPTAAVTPSQSKLSWSTTTHTTDLSTGRDKKINLCATENDSSTPSEVADLLNQILQPVKGKSLAQINAQTTQQIYQKLRNSKNLEGTVYRVIRVALLFDVDQNLRFANRLVIGFTGSHKFALQYDLTQSKTVSWTGFGNMAYLLFDESGRIDTWSGKTRTTQHKVPLGLM